MTCPRCGRENEGKYRFCLGCGAALAAAPGRAPTGAVPPLGAIPPAPVAKSATQSVPLTGKGARVPPPPMPPGAGGPMGGPPSGVAPVEELPQWSGAAPVRNAPPPPGQGQLPQLRSVGVSVMTPAGMPPIPPPPPPGSAFDDFPASNLPPTVPLMAAPLAKGVGRATGRVPPPPPPPHAAASIELPPRPAASARNAPLPRPPTAQNSSFIQEARNDSAATLAMEAVTDARGSVTSDAHAPVARTA